MTEGENLTSSTHTMKLNQTTSGNEKSGTERLDIVVDLIKPLLEAKVPTRLLFTIGLSGLFEYLPEVMVVGYSKKLAGLMTRSAQVVR